MNKNRALSLMLIILLGAFFLRQYRLLDFPYHGDEVDEGDIALEILHGHLAPFYPQNEGNEPLYQFSLAPFFALLGDSVIANRFPSAAWSMIFVALMYTYGRELFLSRRAGALSAALAASLWLPTVFGRLGLREITQPVMMIPALLPLPIILRDSSIHPIRIAIFGGIFAGLTAYTFLSGRGFPVIVILFLIYAILAQRNSLCARWRAFAIYFFMMLAWSTPLWVYLTLHPDMDFHVRELTQHGSLDQADFSALTTSTLATLSMFTVRGDLNWVRNIPGRPVFVGMEGWIFYLGIALCLWHWRKPEYVLQLIVIATMFVPNILTEDPPRWTRSIGILPGLIAATIVPVESVWARLARFSRTRVVYGALIALLGVSIYARTAFDLFDVWIDHPGVYWMTLAFYDGAGKYIHQSPETTPVNYVMDVYTDWRKHNVTRVAQRKDVELRFSVKNALVFPDNASGLRIAFQIFGDPARPLELAFLDGLDLVYTDPRADPGGNHPLQIYFIPRARLDERIARAKSNAVFLPNTRTRVEAFQVADLLEFNGYEILNPARRPGEELNVLTYWRVRRAPSDLAIFLHLLDPNGNVIVQYDGFDVVTEDLKPEDIIVQLHALKLPNDLARAAYRFEIGAYTRADGKRSSLIPGGDHLWLQTWEPPPPSQITTP